MNSVNFRDTCVQIFGSDDEFRRQNLAYLLTIQKWLTTDGKPCYKLPNRVRMAASLTTRAEAELFSLSSPRFSVRLYADEEHRSFFNLRRSALLVQQIKDQGGWVARQADPSVRIPGIEEYTEAPLPEVELPGIIADSAFAVPERFKANYRVITSDLHAAYADSLARNAKPATDPLPASGANCPGDDQSACPTTPFVQHFWTTGLCGHAAVFMASMLMHKHTKVIHALAEIAALLKDPAKNEILIVGLSPRHISRYFSMPQVGLQAFPQTSPFYPPSSTQDPWLSFQDDFNPEECFRNALRSYLLSRMPIIKHVDLGRLHGSGMQAENVTPIYTRNQTGFTLTKCPPQADHHTILLIGCAKGQDDGFLLHDPAGMPYLEANAAQLMRSSTYVNEQAHPSDPTHILTERALQPVTPHEVLMPLHAHQVGDTRSTTTRRPGLYQIAAHFYEDIAASENSEFADCCPTRRQYLAGEFRLVQARCLLAALNDDTWTVPGAGAMSEPLRQAVLAAQDDLLKLDAQHWFWVQRFPKSCWIWDAEQLPPANNAYEHTDLLKYVVAIASESGPTVYVRTTYISPKPPSDTSRLNAPPTTPPDPLPISLVSSFHAQSIKDAATNWPEGVEFAELYTFMQKDVADFVTPGNPHQPAVAAMASLARNDVEINRVATAIAEMFDAKNVKVRGFATFIPELLGMERHPTHPDAEDNYAAQGRDALLFLCKLAGALRSLPNPHPVDVIEIVGGSIINGLLPVKYNGKRCMLANMKSPLAPPKALLDNICLLYKSLPDPSDRQVRFAIEMEPGPLFAVGSQEGIDSIVSEIRLLEATGNLPHNSVGLNVDIGHYILGYIPATKLRESKIAERIFNGHASDHPKAHTGDCVVGTINNISAFRPWSTELRSAPQSQFQGRISVEMECVKDNVMLRDAVLAVTQMLNQTISPNTPTQSRTPRAQQ